MPTQWYALHSKLRKEALLWQQPCLHQVEDCYPCIRVQPVNPRARKVKPYFPVYVFGYVHLERTNLSIFQWMPGSAGIVALDGVLSHVPDSMIAAIRRRVDEINAAGGELFDGLKSGDVVHVQEGPFAGYEAIFEAHLPGDDRASVLPKLINKQLPMDLPAGQIQIKKKEGLSSFDRISF